MAKEWTVVILIMILDVDVTAAGGIIKLIAPKGETTHYILRVAGAPSTGVHVRPAGLRPLAGGPGGLLVFSKLLTYRE